jgi:hypothetical protein
MINEGSELRIPRNMFNHQTLLIFELKILGFEFEIKS